MKLDSDRWKLEAVEVDNAEELFWPSTFGHSSHRFDSFSRSITQRSSQVLSHSDKQNPIDLKQLALQAYLVQLKNLCQEKNYGENKRALKHYLKFQLPSPLRQQLLNLSLKDHRIYTLVDSNMFELLLSTNVRYVNVQSVRSFFRLPFVTSLRQLGTGLEHFILQDSSWLQRRESLPSALSRMTHLRRISLRYLANDMMIAALAKNCHHLREMDVSYSLDVTDAGIKVLCDPDHQMFTTSEKLQPSTVNSGRNKEKRCRKISAPATVSSGCMVWLPRLVRGIRRYSVVEQQANREPMSLIYQEEDTSPWSEDEVSNLSLDDGKTPQSCIRSLCRLELLGTNVTSYGMQLISTAAPTLTIVS